ARAEQGVGEGIDLVLQLRVGVAQPGGDVDQREAIGKGGGRAVEVRADRVAEQRRVARRGGVAKLRAHRFPLFLASEADRSSSIAGRGQVEQGRGLPARAYPARARMKPAAAVPQSSTATPYRPSGAAARGPNAAAARAAAIAKSRIEVVSSSADPAGRAERTPSA